MESSRGQVARVLREASEAEANGQCALAGLLALHVLQLDPSSVEAKAIFDRSQAALGRSGSEDAWSLSPDQPEALSVRTSDAGSTLGMQSVEELLLTQPPSLPYDLSHVPPLMPSPGAPSGLGFRLYRTAFPLLALGLLLAALWLNFGPSSGPVQVSAGPAASDPPSAVEPQTVASDPASPPAPGTVALNVVPWARVDAIYSVGDGRIIQPDGLISPCTISLPPGEYRFGVSHPDFGSVELLVTVKSEQISKVEHSLISTKELENQLRSSASESGSEGADRPADSEPQGPMDGVYVRMQRFGEFVGSAAFSFP